MDGAVKNFTREHEASIQRDILRQIGMGTDYRMTIAQVRRECSRLIQGMQARHLQGQAGQNRAEDN